MRVVLSLLVVAAVSLALPTAAAAADEPATGTGAAVAPRNAHTLAQVHGGLTSDGSRAAGQSRDVAMSAGKTDAAKVVRPAPTPRVLRRMSPERTVSAVGPAVRACAAVSTSAASTAFGLRVSVAPGGEVEGAELASTTRVPPALVACVVKALSVARFGAPGSSGASIVVPVTVPGRAALADAPAATAAAPVAADPKPDVVATKQ